MRKHGLKRACRLLILAVSLQDQSPERDVSHVFLYGTFISNLDDSDSRTIFFFAVPSWGKLENVLTDTTAIFENLFASLSFQFLPSL